MSLDSQQEAGRALTFCHSNGLIDESDTSVIFIDRNMIADRVQRLNDSFPDSTIHAIAIKSNPLQSTLKLLVEMGAGLEAASLSEVMMAAEAGASLDRIVFDSPAKTKEEIDFLQSRYPGIRINADSLDELIRYPQTESKFRLGLRVNPNVVSETVDSMNVGGANSKFGQRMTQTNNEIIDHCLRWRDVDCLHFHIGSQHQNFEPVFTAANRVVQLAESINEAAGFRKIKNLDIGGGFPVNYTQGPSFQIEDYATALRTNCPKLFDGSYELITEFGRYIHAHAGWVATRVEYVKETPSERQIAIVHVGADMFLRECYNPDDWQHKHFVLQSDFAAKTEPAAVTVDFAGPLCFGGDFVVRNSRLPKVKVGDWLIIQDVGANSFALWSRHCSRPFPKVIQINTEEFEVVKSRESFDSIAQFWK